MDESSGYNNQDLRSLLSEANEEMSFLAGHDNAILGVAEGHHKEAVVVYDIEVVIMNLEEQGLTDSQARRHFDKEIGNHTGQKNMPIFVDSIGVRMVPSVFEINLDKFRKKHKHAKQHRPRGRKK